MKNVNLSSIKKQEQYIVKYYGGDEFRIVCMRSLKEKGWERDDFKAQLDEWLKVCGWTEKKKNVSRETPERLKESVSRSKRIIFEYAKCNNWEHFVTLTLDKKKVDRRDLKGTVVKMGRMIDKLNKENKALGMKEIKYVIVPECHKDGAIHFHGLMTGLRKFDHLRINEHGYTEWKQWREEFGFNNIQEIKDKDKICGYVTKYCSKELARAVKESGMHLFYASHGLDKPMVIYKGYGEYEGEWDFIQENGYCKIATVNRKQLEENFKHENNGNYF